MSGSFSLSGYHSSQSRRKEDVSLRRVDDERTKGLTEMDRRKELNPTILASLPLHLFCYFFCYFFFLTVSNPHK